MAKKLKKRRKSQKSRKPKRRQEGRSDYKASRFASFSRRWREELGLSRVEGSHLLGLPSRTMEGWELRRQPMHDRLVMLAMKFLAVEKGVQPWWNGASAPATPSTEPVPEEKALPTDADQQSVIEQTS